MEEEVKTNKKKIIILMAAVIAVAVAAVIIMIVVSITGKPKELTADDHMKMRQLLWKIRNTARRCRLITWLLRRIRNL